jgi:hypothetical protein
MSTAVTVVVGTPDQQWLNQVSLVELDRPPTQDELTRWVNQLNEGDSRNAVVDGIAHSPEAKAVNLQNLFQDFLGRKGTTKQLVGVVAAADSTHTSPAAVILGSKEFFDKSGGTIDGFLTALESVVIGNTVPQAVLESQLEEGVLPIFVAEEVLQSNVGKSGLLTAKFQSVLGRLPTRGEQICYVQQMDQGIYLRQIVASLLAGNEFFKKATTAPAG